MSVTKDPGSYRVEFLDGIRGWAALIVVLDHAVTMLCQYTSQYSGRQFRFITDGHLAVLIFFVLSGYALSVSNFGENKNRLALSVIGRIFRLGIPVLATSILAYLLLKAGLLFNVQAATSPEKSSIWLGTFYGFAPDFLNAVKFSMFDVFFDWNGATSYNISCWTMQYELAGSYMIYAYIAIFRRKTVLWIPAIALAVFWMFRQPLYACFFGGYLIAELNQRFPAGKNMILQSLSVLGFLGVIMMSTFCRVTDDRITCLMAAAFVLSVSYSPALKAVFSSKASSFMGRISFPLYLVQIIVICSLSSWLFLKLPAYHIDRGTISNIIFFATLASCIISAYLLLPVERLSIVLSKKSLGLHFIEEQNMVPRSVC